MGPICYENTDDNTGWRRPDSALFSNIPMLWEFLELITQDWQKAIEPYQNSIDNSTSDSEQHYFMTKGFLELQPTFLKCLFSYIFFFASLEDTYGLFLTQLDNLNQLPFLRVAHEKRPKKTPYIEKVRLIRNHGIAHIGGNKGKANHITSRAAIIWQPLSITKKENEIWNMNKLQFGGFTISRCDAVGNLIEQSEDLKINGISELHEQCTEYLEQYDNCCASYLETIISKVPFVEGNSKVFALKQKIT